MSFRVLLFSLMTQLWTPVLMTELTVRSNGTVASFCDVNSSIIKWVKYSILYLKIVLISKLRKCPVSSLLKVNLLWMTNSNSKYTEKLISFHRNWWYHFVKTNLSRSAVTKQGNSEKDGDDDKNLKEKNILTNMSRLTY